MITPQEVKDLGLPCYDNAQRLARLETLIETMDKKLDSLVEDPCQRCKNGESVAVLRTEMRVIKWAGSIIGGTFLVTLAERFFK